MAKKKRIKKNSVRHRNKKGQFSKRGKRERVYSHAKTIAHRIAREEKARKKREKQKQIPPPEPTQFFEWIVNFSYEKSGRSFDIIIVSADETDAYNQAVDFLRNDVDAERIVKSGFRGWTPSIARGRETNVQTEPEYRNDSEA
jgi:hypothetical protein